MNSILDRVAHSFASKYSNFVPTNPDEFFILRLAVKLDDGGAAKHYLQLSNQFSQHQMLVAYRRTLNAGSQEKARRFHVELNRLMGRNGYESPHRRLAAIRIERRAIAVAFFNGDRLEYPPIVRQLSAQSEKAAATTTGFLIQMLTKCPVEAASVEIIATGDDVKRSVLSNLVKRILSEHTISLWEIHKNDILKAFAFPPLRFRRQIRQIVSSIWPDIDDSFGTPIILDALAMGLYCQIEYLFNL
jgi:hypothetical protein